jgi:hypothetical protein
VTKAKRHLQAIPPSANHEEAAAIVSAIARFMHDTAPLQVSASPTQDAWHAAAILDGVSRDPWAAATGDAWLQATPG